MYNKVVKEIFVGVCILVIVWDYWCLVIGRMSGIEMSFCDVKLEMKKYRNICYDGEFLDLLFEVEDVMIFKLFFILLKVL